MGRPSVTSILLVGLGFAEVTARAYAESRDEEEEDLSTGEISHESSFEVSGSDETSFDDDLAGDSADSLKLAHTLLLTIEPGDEFRNNESIDRIIKQTITEPHPYASSRLHLFGTRPR
jgi:hypothetical protein